MKGKLIKEYSDYYLVSDAEIQPGDEYVKLGGRPRELFLGCTFHKTPVANLSLKNCQAIERGYDLDELASEYANKELNSELTSKAGNFYGFSSSFKEGFQKALELLSDKKFSEKDMRRAMSAGLSIGYGRQFDIEMEGLEIHEYIKSLQQTEWDVELIELEDGEWYEKIQGEPPMKVNIQHNKAFDGVLPKLDNDGCLILKRIDDE